MRRRQEQRHTKEEDKAHALDERFRNRLSIELRQLRLVIEQIHLRRAASHIEVDHPLRLRRKVQARIGGSRLPLEQGSERRAPNAEPGRILKKLPACLFAECHVSASLTFHPGSEGRATPSSTRRVWRPAHQPLPQLPSYAL